VEERRDAHEEKLKEINLKLRNLKSVNLKERASEWVKRENLKRNKYNHII
jgi:hypothetical protein